MEARIIWNASGETPILVLDTSSAAGAELQITVLDPRTGRYLSLAGWVTTRKTLLRTKAMGQDTEIPLEAASTQWLMPGGTYVVEDIFVNLRAPFTWPLASASPGATDGAGLAATMATSPLAASPALRGNRKVIAAAGIFVLGLIVAAAPLALLWRGDVSRHAKEIATIGANRARLEANATAESAARKRLETENASIGKDLRSARDDLAAMQARLDTTRDLTSEARNSAQTAREQTETIKRQRDEDVAALREELARITKGLNAARDGADAANRLLEESRSNAAALRKSVRERDAMIAELQDQLREETGKHGKALAARETAGRSINATVTSLTDLLRQREDENAQLAQRFAAQAPASEAKLADADEVEALTSTLTTASAEIDQLKRKLEYTRVTWAERLKVKTIETVKLTSQLQLDLAARDKIIKDQTSTITFHNRDLAAANNRITRMESELKALPGNRAVWGAAALNPQSGIIYTLPNQTDIDGAKNGVMDICAARSRGGCELLHEFSKMCISVARISGQRARPNNFGWALGQTWEATESMALRDCQTRHGRDCSASYTICSPDSLSGSARE